MPRELSSKLQRNWPRAIGKFWGFREAGPDCAAFQRRAQGLNFWEALPAHRAAA